jgi:hypothetical protein
MPVTLLRRGEKLQLTVEPRELRPTAGEPNAP